VTLILITPPTIEPVSVAEAKLAARLDGSHWDTIVAGAIAGAREVAEHQTGRKFMAQVIRLELVDWPTTADELPCYRPTAVAITYWNGSAWVALAGGAFAWAAQDPGFVMAPALGTSWPTLGEVAVGPRVRVDATVGATDAADVPAAATGFIKAMVAVIAADPTLTVTDALASSAYLPRMLDPLRLYR
jgi:uncharacterized phiE125 gp8 family phage protein